MVDTLGNFWRSVLLLRIENRHSRSSPWWRHSLGSCFVSDFLDSGWDFAVRGSYCLCSSLCSSLRSAPYSCQCSLGQGCCSSIEGHWMSCIGACFVLGDRGYSIADIAVEGRMFRRFYFLQIRSLVGLLTEHLRGPSWCVLGM